MEHRVGLSLEPARVASAGSWPLRPWRGFSEASKRSASPKYPEPPPSSPEIVAGPAWRPCVSRSGGFRLWGVERSRPPECLSTLSASGGTQVLAHKTPPGGGGLRRPPEGDQRPSRQDGRGSLPVSRGHPEHRTRRAVSSLWELLSPFST